MSDIPVHTRALRPDFAGSGDAVLGSAFGEGRAEHEFRRARRHTLFVRTLKIGLPLMAAVIVLSGIAVTWLARSLPDNVAVASTSLEDGRIVMEDPRMSGFDSQQRPYSMVAVRAIQSLVTGQIELESVRAAMSISDDETADVEAARGRYDPAKERLFLSGGINVITSRGMSIRMDEAELRLKAGQLIGKGPVSITTPGQAIESGRMTVGEGGRILSFKDKVKMTLYPARPSDIDRRVSESH